MCLCKSPRRVCCCLKTLNLPSRISRMKIAHSSDVQLGFAWKTITKKFPRCFAGGKWIKWRIINEFSRAIKKFFMWTTFGRATNTARAWWHRKCLHRLWTLENKIPQDYAERHLRAVVAWLTLVLVLFGMSAWEIVAKILINFLSLGLVIFRCLRAGLTNKSRLKLNGKFTTRE